MRLWHRHNWKVGAVFTTRTRWSDSILSTSVRVQCETCAKITNRKIYDGEMTNDQIIYWIKVKYGEDWEVKE